MRVDEVFKQAASQGTAPVSFEMFPPKGELTLDTAREVAGNLCKLSPSFVSVTCSAGGSGNGATTAPIAHMISSEFDTPSVAHLTCVGRTHADIAAKIDEYRTAGVENILALRGDLPAGATEDDKPASDYAYARDLIPELVDAGFCVGAAAYPEGHIACEDLNLSVEHLKQKQDAGASFFVTQLFFDNECFYRFRELADKAGITVPITAGIMPFMGKSQISRMVFMCGASLPSPVIKILAKYENDPESLQAAGVDYAARQLCDLKEHGADGLHLYTMNRPAIARPLWSAWGNGKTAHRYNRCRSAGRPCVAGALPCRCCAPSRVDRAEMLRYLGYGGQQIEPELSRRIELVVERLELDIEPRGVRRVFAVDATGVDEQSEPCIRLVGTNVELRGRDIYRHLKDARFAALMACTLGMDAERRLRTTGAQHPLEGAVLDAACSAYVEAAVEQMDQQVKTDAAAHGLAGNWRFSPGYGDCPLSAQRSIVNALNATRLIGLTVTPTSLLMPTKSVTAVIGLFDGEVHDAQSRPTCNICRMRENCRFRAAHTTCYSSH